MNRLYTDTVQNCSLDSIRVGQARFSGKGLLELRISAHQGNKVGEDKR